MIDSTTNTLWPSSVQVLLLLDRRFFFFFSQAVLHLQTYSKAQRIHIPTRDDFFLHPQRRGQSRTWPWICSHKNRGKIGANRTGIYKRNKSKGILRLGWCSFRVFLRDELHLFAPPTSFSCPGGIIDNKHSSFPFFSGRRFSLV
jgi:hypothetical protein